MLKRFYYILSEEVEECSIDLCSGQIIRKECFLSLKLKILSQFAMLKGVM